MQLSEALRAVLAGFARASYQPSFIYGSSKPIRLPRLSITKIGVRGRSVTVHVGRGRSCSGDRTALLSLARDLWGEPISRCHGARDLALNGAEEETVAYIRALHAVAPDDARAVCAHLFGSLLAERGGPLADLFPKRLYAWRHLDSASSGGALVKRALPHAAKGTVIDRVAAIHSLDAALDDAWRHRDAEAVEAHVRALAATLARAESPPLLQECAWLLARKLDWCAARRDALRRAERKQRTPKR